MKVHQGKLSTFSTFQIGEGLTTVHIAENKDDLVQLFQAGFFHKPFVLIGGGSNTIFVNNHPTLLQYTNADCIEITQGDSVQLTIGAGMSWHSLVEYTVKKGLWGLENLALIPGTVGASPVQNIGAYGTELSHTLSEVEYFDYTTGSFHILSKDECRFGYRDSVFKHELKNKAIITNITLRLSSRPQPILTYPTLADYLQNVPQPNQKNIFDAVIAIRSSKLPDPKTTPNCGSFFKNPVITKQKADALLAQYASLPLYNFGSQYKTSAAWLIDQAALKGYTYNGITVHHQQPLVLVNSGNASPEALLTMKEHIVTTVYQKFGITLETEVNLL